jgi:flagellar motor switch protein FliN/FliY
MASGIGRNDGPDGEEGNAAIRVERLAADGSSAGSAARVFRELSASAVRNNQSAGVDRMQEIPVQLSVELGRTEVPLRTLLQLEPGTVIELDRLAGEPVDVFINDRLVAQGEVVTVNTKRGVRFTDIIAPHERLHRGD